MIYTKRKFVHAFLTQPTRSRNCSCLCALLNLPRVAGTWHENTSWGSTLVQYSNARQMRVKRIVVVEKFVQLGTNKPTLRIRIYSTLVLTTL